MWLYFFAQNRHFLFLFCRSQEGLWDLNVPLALPWRVSPHLARVLVKGVLLAFTPNSLCPVFRPLCLSQSPQAWLTGPCVTVLQSHQGSCPSDPRYPSLLISKLCARASAS